jgi:hypothetical protein
MTAVVLGYAEVPGRGLLAGAQLEHERQEDPDLLPLKCDFFATDCNPHVDGLSQARRGSAHAIYTREEAVRREIMKERGLRPTLPFFQCHSTPLWLLDSFNGASGDRLMPK